MSFVARASATVVGPDDEDRVAAGASTAPPFRAARAASASAAVSCESLWGSADPSRDFCPALVLGRACCRAKESRPLRAPYTAGPQRPANLNGAAQVSLTPNAKTRLLEDESSPPTPYFSCIERRRGDRGGNRQRSGKRRRGSTGRPSRLISKCSCTRSVPVLPKRAIVCPERTTLPSATSNSSLWP